MKCFVIQRVYNDIEAHFVHSVQMQHEVLTARQARVVD